jgi:hypothetical protein
MAVREILLASKQRIHTYHGEADLLELNLKRPFQDRIRPQAKLELYGPGEDSHYQYKHAGPFRLDGIVSYQSGYTQVAAARSLRHEGRFCTLATSVLEGFNILDVFTADRIVSQISSAHPIDGAVPEISFVGTRFENLRIAGHKVELDTNFDILGPRPAPDASYFDNQKVMDGMAKQYEKISRDQNLPDWGREEYPRDCEEWRATAKTKDSTSVDIAKCSLVNRVDCNQKSFGHVIEIPHFGRFYLAELQVERELAKERNDFDTYSFTLTMVRMELGCATSGSGSGGTSGTNGTGKG